MTSIKDSIKKKLLKPKLWDDDNRAIEDNLLGIVMMHTQLILLENCQTILRRDYDNMPKKVKLISGGAVGNEPAYSGFVGPGMLTASISGNISSSPPSNSILKLIKEIGTDHIPGVLIIIENRPGYRINFATAVLRAESEYDLNVKLLLIGDVIKPDNIQFRENYSQPNILFILKIAGAMANEGETLPEIHRYCQEFAMSGAICGINVGIKSSYQTANVINEMEIGDLKLPFTSLKNMATTLLKIMLESDSKGSSRYFMKGHHVVLIVNETGCNDIEKNIFTKDVTENISDYGLIVERSYVGRMMSFLDQKGFYLCLVDLSFDQNLIRYLDQPVRVPAWPRLYKSITVNDHSTPKENYSTPGRNLEAEIEDTEIRPLGPSLSERSAQAFLTVLSFACEALIACSEQLDIMDAESGDGDCGTTLANGAKAIKSAIKSFQILGINLYVTLTQISRILEQKMGGLQGGLYSLFFQAIAKVFSKNSESGNIDSWLWLEAFTTGNRIISEFGGAKEGDRTMLDPLLSAEKKLKDTLIKNHHPIEAFGEAVKSAEECVIRTINMPNTSKKAEKRYVYPDAGAHAVGIWLRASYEGVKLKFTCECGE